MLQIYTFAAEPSGDLLTSLPGYLNVALAQANIGRDAFVALNSERDTFVLLVLDLTEEQDAQLRAIISRYLPTVPAVQETRPTPDASQALLDRLAIRS